MITTFSNMIEEIETYPAKHKALEKFMNAHLNNDISVELSSVAQSLKVYSYTIHYVDIRSVILDITFVERQSIDKPFHEIRGFYSYDVIKNEAKISVRQGDTKAFNVVTF